MATAITLAETPTEWTFAADLDFGRWVVMLGSLLMWKTPLADDMAEELKRQAPEEWVACFRSL